jgi:hypothetical protein
MDEIAKGLVNKGIPRGLAQVAGKAQVKVGGVTRRDQKLEYAANRLKAHQMGNKRQVPHLRDFEQGQGLQARKRSRLNLVDVGKPSLAPTVVQSGTLRRRS